MYYLKTVPKNKWAILIMLLVSLTAGCQCAIQSEIVNVSEDSITLTEIKWGHSREALIKREGNEIRIRIKKDGVECAPTPADMKWIAKHINLAKWTVVDTSIDKGVKSEIESLWVEESIPLEKIISLIKKLHFSSQRKGYLLKIAHRNNLSPEEQKLVVTATFDILDFDSDKTEVLSAVINNPSTNPETKRLIVDNIERISFDSDKIKLMKLLLQQTK